MLQKKHVYHVMLLIMCIKIVLFVTRAHIQCLRLKQINIINIIYELLALIDKKKTLK